MFQSGLAFGTFDNPRWRAFFLTISGGLFSGPGDRRAVGGSLLQSVLDRVLAQVLAVMAAHHGRTLTCDGSTDANSMGAYNVIDCAPVPCIISVFQLGVNPSTVKNLLNGLVSSLPRSLTEPQPVSALLRGRDIPKARLHALLGFPFWAMVSDNASNKVLMRNKPVESGLSIMAYGCFAQVVNLLAKDVSKQSALQLGIKSAVTWSVFFHRCTRARSSLTNDRAVQRLAGVLIEPPKPFSHTRWVGQSVVIRSYLSNLEASRRVLAANRHNPTGSDVPDSVFLAVDQADTASSATVAAPV